jgi:hypothetical protein
MAKEARTFGGSNEKAKELKKVQNRIARMRALIDTDYKTLNLQFEVQHPELVLTLDRLIEEVTTLKKEVVAKLEEQLRAFEE